MSGAEKEFNSMPTLGVNIDHVATLRQARGGNLADPLAAALLSEKAGAQSIVAHLREDRRHIQDRDIQLLKKNIKTRLNLEMSVNSEIIKIACRIKPYQATLVPERRKELTTEGGLNVVSGQKQIAAAISKLNKSQVAVSLFIDPDFKQISSAQKIGAKIIELHTGAYAEAKNLKLRKKLLQQVADAAFYAQKLGLTVNAGHGLDYNNARALALIPGLNELNIGYAIICRALYVGLFQAVREMGELIQ